MHADLDLLCITVYCTADDLLPERRRNARRRLTDAEIVTLCVAQVLMGIPSDRRFLRAAPRKALAPTTTSCCSTRRQSSAADRSTRRAARNWPRSPATATPAATHAGSG